MKHKKIIGLLVRHFVRMVIRILIMLMPTLLAGFSCITGSVVLFNAEPPWSSIAFFVGAIPAYLLIRKYVNALIPVELSSAVPLPQGEKK